MCIDLKFLCDKADDCGDFSDESSCKPEEGNCSFHEFQCTSNRTICIPESARCNGTSECPHHEDEQGCSDCHVEEFECKNKKCVPTQWICDHTDDCGDGSDESPDLCSNFKTSSVFTTNVPCEHGFRCKSGHCIDMSLVCNGEENCYDGSDENGACNISCNKFHNPCSHGCIKTPSGPICTCNKGYKLSGDGQNCLDIEECKAHPPACSQLCSELSGSFSCSCYDGFILR